MKGEDLAEWDAERNVASHMFSKIKTNLKKGIEHENTRLLQGNAG